MHCYRCSRTVSHRCGGAFLSIVIAIQFIFAGKLLSTDVRAIIEPYLGVLPASEVSLLELLGGIVFSQG